LRWRYFIGPGASVICTFTVPHTGDAGDSWTNNVTVVATDDDSASVGGVSNDVTVSLTDVGPVDLTIVKSVDKLTLPEPGGTSTMKLISPIRQL